MCCQFFFSGREIKYFAEKPDIRVNSKVQSQAIVHKIQYLRKNPSPLYINRLFWVCIKHYWRFMFGFDCMHVNQTGFAVDILYYLTKKTENQHWNTVWGINSSSATYPPILSNWLARILANSQFSVSFDQKGNWLAKICKTSMRNATCVLTQTSKIATKYYIYSYLTWAIRGMSKN